MILSASRRTDIPSFYGDWFLDKIKKGYFFLRNPMNYHQVKKIEINPEKIDCIVFWTKDPYEFFDKLEILDKLGYKYYFQFTLNPYDQSIEPNLPDKKIIISTFIRLSNKIGKQKIVWRYDPIVFTDRFNKEYHFKSFNYLSEKLHEHTDKCIISFINLYRKTRRRLADIKLRDIKVDEKIEIASKFAEIAKEYNIKIYTCAENIDLTSLGIFHGKCIDDNLISKIIEKKIKVVKDKNQRPCCGCVQSVDIGDYDTCGHGCLYCYANSSKKIAQRNLKNHCIESEFIYNQVRNKFWGEPYRLDTLLTNNS